MCFWMILLPFRAGFVTTLSEFFFACGSEIETPPTTNFSSHVPIHEVFKQF